MNNHKLKAWIKAHPGWSFFIGLVLLWRFAGHYPWFYMVGPINGIVVDKNGKPVAGAIAVQQFGIHTSKFHGTASKVVYIAESVTDTKGRYSFKGWGPRFNSFGYRPGEFSPSISVFKQGYRTSSVLNIEDGEKRFYVKFIPEKNPIVIDAYKNIEEELEILKKHSSLIDWRVGAGVKCFWEKIPNFVIEDDKRYRLFRMKLESKDQSQLPVGLDQWENKDWGWRGCLEPKIVFREYLESLPKGGVVK